MLSVEVVSVSHGAQHSPSSVDGAVPSPGQPEEGEGGRGVLSTVLPQPVLWAGLCRARV